MRIGKYLFDGVHGTAWNADPLQHFDPKGRGPSAKSLSHDRFKRGSIAETGSVGCEAAVLSKVGRARYFAPLSELRIVPYRQDDVAVLGLVDIVRTDIRMGISPCDAACVRSGSNWLPR